MKIHEGDLVVSRKYQTSGYLWRVLEIHKPRADTWNKPTVTLLNLGPQHPIVSPEEEKHDKKDRRGGRYTRLLEEVLPYCGYRQPDQMSLI